MTTHAPKSVLEYRGKEMSPRQSAFQFRRSTPPINDLLALIRITLLWITLYSFLMRPGVGIRFGAAWYVDFAGNQILIMRLHPNYSERLSGFFLENKRPDFVHSILGQGDWPYARWTTIPAQPLILLWLVVCVLIWRFTRMRRLHSSYLKHSPQKSQPEQ
jgi:hypothetical protein